MTQTESLVRGLEYCGLVEVPCRSRKYRAFALEGSEQVLLVGRNGALRAMGAGGSVERSSTLTGSKTHLALMEIGKRGQWESPQQARAEFRRLTTLARPRRAVLSSAQIIAAVQRDDGTGLCRACGAEQGGCEPDARGYKCEACGENQVYGAEELMFQCVG